MRSSARGEFLEPNLVPGIYDVSISKEGFHTRRESNLELQLEQEARMVFHLEMGSIAQTVQVAASTPLINTENAVRGDVVVRQELIEIPLNGRDFTDLAMLTAGVLPNNQGTSVSRRALMARERTTNFLVDGFNNQNPRDASAAGTGGLQDPRNFRLERGRSDWDAGHTFTMSFSWEAPRRGEHQPGRGCSPEPHRQGDDCKPYAGPLVPCELQSAGLFRECTEYQNNLFGKRSAADAVRGAVFVLPL